jgi:ATP-dependent exoDNAse (exonuclease V) beta subunit
VVRRIIYLSARFPFGEMAILLRTLNALEPLQRALEEARIPFVVTGAKSFFESREVLDLIQLLRVWNNPLDEISLAGVLRSPLAGVRDETIFRLKQAAGLYEAILRSPARGIPEDDVERLSLFRTRLRRALADRDAVAPDRLLIRAMDEAGYETRSTAAARASISRFLHLVRSAHRNRLPSFAGLVDEIERYRESEAEIEVASDQALNAVHIMSVHRSKGLEFPVVFLPFLHRPPAFSKPPICFAPEWGLAVRWRSPVSQLPISEPAHTLICDSLKVREQEEENRLLYVALTRAGQHLAFSWSESKRTAGGWAATVAKGLPADRKVTVSEPPDAGRADETVLPDPLPRIVYPPPVPEQHDFVVTATSLSEFQSCPRRYYLGRYLGWHGSRESVAGEDEEIALEVHLDASEFGRQVHQALAGAAPPNMDPEAVELCRTFASSELGRRAAHASRIEREYEFITAFGEIVVRGQIDLWFEEAGELILLDYKTDRFDPESEPSRIEGYALQLRIYALALERLNGRLPDRAVLQFLRSRQSIDVSLAPEALRRARLVVEELAGAQQDLNFPLREGKQCLRCEFFGSSCPATVAGSRPSFAAVQP